MTEKAQPDTTAAAEPKRRGFKLFPGIIFMFIGLQLTWMSAVIYLATSEKVAIEPDYYSKAVNWNAHQAQQARNVELGWDVAITAGETVGDKKLRVVQITLNDAAGGGVAEALVDAEYFHRAHANDWRRIRFQPDAAQPGRYAAMLPMGATGIYEFRLHAQQGAKVYEDAVTLEVADR